MTRIVTVFFAAVAFLMMVYWVVPGAKPPAMTAVASPAARTQPQTIVLLPPAAAPAAQASAATPTLPAQALAPASPAPVQAAAPTLLPTSPAPAAVLARVAAKTSGGCAGDPIKCMLEGKRVGDDPDVTGTIAGPASRLAANRPVKTVR
jgi:hypothetical protein